MTLPGRLRPARLLQQIFPPALLTYLFYACKSAAFEIGPEFLISQGYPALFGKLYSLLALTLLPYLTLLYLSLYFLPPHQSIPPQNPPLAITSRRVIFESLSPSAAALVRARDPSLSDRAGPLVNRCWKDGCKGRWKPARARHCSTCGVCRMGFDHHCTLFANCLTAPHLPTFLALLTLTPLTFLALSLPLYRPFLARVSLAYSTSRTTASIVEGWYAKWYSWVAGGPVGHYVGAIILGWKELDRNSSSPSSEMRLPIGILLMLGQVLSLIAAGLAVTSITLILRGDLTIDRALTQSHSRALHAASLLRASHPELPLPDRLQTDLERFGRRYFWVPVGEDGAGAIVSSREGERCYDRGGRGNWELLVGKGWSRLVFPWLRGEGGLTVEGMMNWPLSPEVEQRLREEARRLVEERDEVPLIDSVS